MRSRAGAQMAVDGPYDEYAADHGMRGADAGDARADSGLDRRDVQLEQRNRVACYEDLRVREAQERSDHPDQAERTPDGGWRWKGLELGPAANRVADEGIAARRQAEGRDLEGKYAEAGITPDMRRVEAELEHGTLVPDTERFALKSPDRFKEKLARLIERRPDDAVSDLAAGIHDGIRYTFIFDEACYSDGVRLACNAIAGGCGELDRLVNRWSGEDYKGINSRWLHAESGQFFEVQFHTQQSWEAKQATHDTYEKIDDPTSDVSEIEKLREYQRGIVGSLRMPERCGDIVDYKQPGS